MPKKHQPKQRPNTTRKARADAAAEALRLAQAEAKLKAEQNTAIVQSEPPEPSDEHSEADEGAANEHRKPLVKYSSLQDDPNHPPDAVVISLPDQNEKDKGGRPTLYTDELCVTLEGLLSNGATNQEIATSLGIGLKTLHDWRHRYPHFSHAFDKYRGVANMYVENAMYRSALGYDYTEEQLSKDGIAVECKRHITGSVNAQKFLLTNRMPDRYKNKVETTLSLGADISQIAVAIKRRED